MISNYKQMDFFRDVYPMILARLTPAEIVRFCSTNRYFYNLLDESFWIKLILIRWGARDNTQMKEIDLSTQTCHYTSKAMYEYAFRYREDISQLCYAICDNNEVLVESILARGIDLTIEDWTLPIVKACRWGNLNVVKKLVAYGANINQQIASGDTGLHWAAKNGHTDIVIYLVENGADVTTRTSTGYSAKDLAEIRGQRKIVDYLTEAEQNIK